MQKFGERFATFRFTCHLRTPPPIFFFLAPTFVLELSQFFFFKAERCNVKRIQSSLCYELVCACKCVKVRKLPHGKHSGKAGSFEV